MWRRIKAQAETQNFLTPELLAEKKTVAVILDADSLMTGKTLTLAADAFTQNDSVPLATVGQSASGRMTRPSEFLRLRVGAQGCQLQLDGPAVDTRERVSTSVSFSASATA